MIYILQQHIFDELVSNSRRSYYSAEELMRLWKKGYEIQLSYYRCQGSDKVAASAWCSELSKEAFIGMRKE